MSRVVWMCEKCDELFDRREDVTAHEDNCTVGDEFKCDKCDKIVDLTNDEHGFENNSCHNIDLGRAGYGSSLDGCDLNFNLCDDCLIGLVDSFTWEGQAKVHNSGSNTWGTNEDWIRRQKGEMSDEELEKQGFYSPRQIKAYEEQFPKCRHVKIDEYRDGSKGSSCVFGAFGDSDGNAGEDYGIDNCFNCEFYEERKEGEEIPVVKNYMTNEDISKSIDWGKLIKGVADNNDS